MTVEPKTYILGKCEVKLLITLGSGMTLTVFSVRLVPWAIEPVET